MCGFAGEYVFGGHRADLKLAEKMAGRLNHRGPDEKGSFLSSDGRCAIGFCRLSVIDPPGSHQPMSSADGNATVAFNGEIYNFRKLREKLSADGAQFRSEGDTEVLLHLYQRQGPDFVRELGGMFAFALYDASAGRLVLARDRLGQKPLWYAALTDRVVFASEAKALLAHPMVDAEPDRLSLQYYAMLGYIPSPRTAWTGIAKLLPANILQISEAMVQPQPYWRVEYEPLAADSDVVDLVRSQVCESVRVRMVSDVPLGALLSSGVDSSIIVALMSKAAGKTGGVRTFTAGFEDALYDERPLAQRTSAHCHTDHTELLIRPEPKTMLNELVSMYDEPFADSSAVATWLICRAAREHVTVALAGDGGDEVFGGYDRYRAMHLSATMSTPVYAAVRLAACLARPWASQEERSRSRRLIRFADGLNLSPARQYLHYRALFAADDLPRLFTEDYAAQYDIDSASDWFCELYEANDLPDELSRAQYHDLASYLPDDLLVKTDIASMAASLELRAPMLDHNLVKLGLSLPAERKISRGRGKAILRDAFADMLPSEVFHRPKRGFGVPLGEWLRGPLREEMCESLMDPGFMGLDIFRPDAIAGLLNDHLSGKCDHSHRLWALLVLARWFANQS